jgi:hypothetical protein
MKIKEISKTYNHISLTEVKPHLNINQAFTDDDTYLTGLIAVATEQAENYTETDIALTTLEATDKGTFSLIKLPYTHLKSVDSITVDGVILDPAEYKVIEGLNSFDIEFINQVTGEIKISFKTGFEAVDIKPVLRQAILVKIMDLYDVERSSYNGINYNMNNAFINMLHYYKKPVLI